MTFFGTVCGLLTPTTTFVIVHGVKCSLAYEAIGLLTAHNDW
jgi:hypothetical protein